jgi:hypothetical protein
MKRELDFGRPEEHEGPKRLRAGVTAGPTREEEGFGGVARGEFRTREGEGGKERVGTRGVAREETTGEEGGARERTVGERPAQRRVTTGGRLPLRRPVRGVPTPSADQGKGDEESEKKTTAVAPPPADEALDLLLVELIAERFAHFKTPEPARWREG